MNSQKKRKDMEPACTWSLLSEEKATSSSLASFSWRELTDYREVFRKYLKEKYLKIGVDKCYHHGKHIESRLLIVKEHGISEKTPCGIPQQDHFIEMEHVFDPDEEGSSSSQTVVLQGCAGIGKTAVVHKFMFDWAAGRVTPGRFDYLIYINCREISHVALLSAADLITNTFQDINGPILDIILVYPEKLLFILDGFPELQYPVGDQEEDLIANPQERKPVETLLCSFVRKKLFPESSLLITARPTAMKKLHSLLKQPIKAEILWFTDAEKRAYFLSQFSAANAAMKLFYGLRENEGLDIMSSLPIISWMICSVQQSQGDCDKTLLRSLQTMTDVYLFYFSKCLKTLTGISVWKGQSCLWGLCSLAAEGLQNHQVLFAVSDLRRHGIGVYDTNCTFLNHFLKKAEGGVNVYTFLHYSFQEFLTAVFYALKNDNSWMFFDHLGKTWQEIFQQYGKGFSSLMIQFLFGLLHKGKGKTVETTFGRKVSPGLREELLKWTEKEIKDKSSRLQIEPVDLFHCLYEIQEEEYAKRIIDDLQSIILLQPTYTKMDILAMSFCVKSSHNHLSVSLKCQHLLGFEEEQRASAFMPPALMLNQSFQLRNLPMSRLHFLCQALRNPYCKIKDLKLIFCHLTASCGRDLSLVFETNQYLTDLEFVKNTLEDSGMKLLCEGLKQPNCILQALRLYRCLISPASCGALAAVLSTNQWLTELEFSETKLEASALKLLCEGLKDPNCKLQKLKLCASLLPENSEAVCKYLASVLICNPHLTELDLSENPLGDIGVKYLCEGLRHSNCKLEKLDLSTCYLTQASCVELSSFLQVSQTLKELFVFANALGDTGVQHLCEGLQHAKGIIENLVLSECSLSAACCEPLAQVLSSTQSLTRLLLINNKIGDLGLKLLCEGLKQPDCQLKDLALWTCHLTGACCQDLCNALYTNEHLRDLDLSDNALGDKGMQVLCEGLKHPCCKLQTLWLAECHLTDACCGALASVLNRNDNLTLLDLSGNDLKDFGVQMLCDALIHPICKLQTFYIDTDHLHEDTFRKMEALKISKPGITW
ncbi:NACHT, LRR and PYD domains-containing protein 3 [Tupaia chinensis]|uniref:NACHT, LRR and PYD domains-containing protein 3 n=1 Tax=Tupaia chinensis TaxID=246437 RepID=UPI0003C8CF8C|nr:NACHT, LRR and PYD domains-containing protein 3 [Tupaia chinensis]XP_006142886.1 NACHT, LRR and PYD domains-containing protein 3 [Tupaia chinensis]XP_014441185.1 NACHT, LRR and PYD domains-containing protein 3 [Tupaia chinensis]XP_014441186.1 NACHT, LRR and PYD domains-containing protein 3 [Tupaia chinensis]XP_014441187.1 NACHT, LRR and PYD domains-containing protein 3 [Tupaia chinensis]